MAGRYSITSGIVSTSFGIAKLTGTNPAIISVITSEVPGRPPQPRCAFQLAKGPVTLQCNSLTCSCPHFITDTSEAVANDINPAQIFPYAD